MGEKQLRKIFIIFTCGIVLVLLAPYLLTRSFGFISFKDTGTIGDTIGGITSPITSLIGSVLVFYALKAQIEANKIIEEQIRAQKDDDIQKKTTQYLLDQFKILREDINDFTYITFKNDNEGEKQVTNYLTRKGRDAFRQVIVGMKQFKTDQHLPLYKTNPKLLEVKSIFLALQSLITQLKLSNIPKEDKAFIKSLMTYQFDSKIKPAFEDMDEFKETLQKPCEECGEVHTGIPDELFELKSRIVFDLDNF